MKESPWHIVHTRHEREKKVAGLFIKKGLNAYCPLNNSRVKYGNREKIVVEPLFTSYVFVRLNEQQKSSVLQTNGVIGFVYWLYKPALVWNEEIGAIKLFLKDYPQVILEKIAVDIDEPVRIISEPLIVRKGNVMEISNPDSKLVLPSLGYMMVADMRKEYSESFIYTEELRARM